MAKSSRRIRRELEKAGWVKVRQSGSHVQFKHPAKPGLVTLPHPKKDLPAGTVRAIARQSGLDL